MISGGRNCKEIERKKSEQKQSENRAKTELYEISQPKEKLLRNEHFVAKPFRNILLRNEHFMRIFVAAKASLAHECHFATQEPPFRSGETSAKL